jgi:hypothetical protein
MKINEAILCDACSVDKEDLRNTRVERMMQISSDNGPALRLLYACLTPLDDAMPNTTYMDFVTKVPEWLRSKLTCRDVMQFLRRSLQLPPKLPLLLLVLIDEGNAAEEAFPPAVEKPLPKVSFAWVLCICEPSGSTALKYWIRFHRPVME